MPTTSFIMSNHPQGTAASIHNPASAHGTPQAANINLSKGPVLPYHELQPSMLNPRQQYLLNWMQELMAPMQQELAERDAAIQNLMGQVEQLCNQLNVVPAQIPHLMLTMQARPPEEFTGDCIKFEGWIS